MNTSLKRKGGVKRGRTQKNAIFADVYDGDSNKAADIAGLSHNHGRKLMMSATAASITPAGLAVQERIRKREETEVRPKVLSRQQRQEFWSDVIIAEDTSVADKLRASELLGRSEIDFVEKRIEENLTLADIAARMSCLPAVEAVNAIEGEIDDSVPAVPSADVADG